MQRCRKGSKKRMPQSELTSSSDQRFWQIWLEKPVLLSSYDKAQKMHRTHPNASPQVGNRLREGPLKPDTLKESIRPRPNSRAHATSNCCPRPITRSHAVALLPRGHAGVGPRAQHGCANQGQHDGAAPAEAPPARPPSEAEARGAARFNSRTRHLRAGRLAAPVAQTRRGAHDGYQTKSCRVFE